MVDELLLSLQCPVDTPGKAVGVLYTNCKAGVVHITCTSRNSDFTAEPLSSPPPTQFCERVQLDSIVYNELGNPEDLVSGTEGTANVDEFNALPRFVPLVTNVPYTQ